jgi:hypothetical protein
MNADGPGLVLSLLGSFSGEKLLTLEKTHLSLEAHGASAPLLEYFGVVVELSAGSISEPLKGVAIFRVYTGEGNNGSVLLVNKGTNTALALDNDVGYIHALAESGKESNKLDGVNIVSDDDKLGLLLFDEVSHVLEAVLEGGRGGITSLGTSSLGTASSLDALLLGSAGLGGVLAKELEEFNGLVLAEGVLELVDDRGDLQALLENLALPLDADVLGPADVTAKVGLVL